jgi:hypothetical protein
MLAAQTTPRGHGAAAVDVLFDDKGAWRMTYATIVTSSREADAVERAILVRA